MSSHHLSSVYYLLVHIVKQSFGSFKFFRLFINMFLAYASNENTYKHHKHFLKHKEISVHSHKEKDSPKILNEPGIILIALNHWFDKACKSISSTFCGPCEGVPSSWLITGKSISSSPFLAKWTITYLPGSAFYTKNK